MSADGELLVPPVGSDEGAPEPGELVDLWAVDSLLFCHEFFPATTRQESPFYHRRIFDLLDSTERYVSIEVFRGGAKTSILRMFTAKRVAYALSRTILYVGKSEAHAVRSVRWLKRQIERNKKLCETFGLQKGEPWTNGEICIENTIEGCSIFISAFGISGSTRGVNFDDYRPDLIIVDDVVDEENAATKEMRKKIIDLVFGSLKESLVPETETPFAKLVILQTPQDFEDISQLAAKDGQFASARFGCWTLETKDHPLEMRESAWPARWSNETLRREKLGYIQRNMLSVFAREMECTLITPENSKFREEWLRFWGPGQEQEYLPPLHEMWTVLIIDPVPPPSPKEIHAGFVNKDYEYLTVLGRWKGKIFLCEASGNRGHEPNWTGAEFFRLCNAWRPRKVVIEAVAYQRTLVWLLRQAMQRAGRYWPIETFDDKRAKLDRIIQGLSGVTSNFQLYVHRLDHSEFIHQFIHYPNVKHDDFIETVAVGCQVLQHGSMLEGDEKLDESEIEDLPQGYRAA